MTPMLPDFSLMVAEIFMLGMGCLLLLVDAFLSDQHRRFSYAIAQGTLLLTALIVVLQSGSWTALSFGGNYVKDAMGDVFTPNPTDVNYVDHHLLYMKMIR